MMKILTGRQTLLIPAVMLCLSVAFVGKSFATEKISDTTINLNVRDALRDDDRVDASEIIVKSKNGIVTLSGSLDSMAGKKYADLETKKIYGVRGVVNKISVVPTWRSDADIRNAVQRRILNSAVIDSQGIEVSSSGGTVTLSGSVDAWNESQEAALLASEVRGVKKVVDDISTKWTTKRSDQEIKNDVVAKLGRDVYLESLPIAVAVKNGMVTLTGTVGSAYESSRAYDAVRWISHVKGLENKLKVDSWRDHGTRTKKSIPSDSELRDAVRNELKADSRVNTADIEVAVSYGSVTLTGTVYSHKEKKTAEQDVRDVIGVAWVSNKLFPRVDERANWVVKDDVAFNLNTDATTEGFDIGVKVKDGIVTLSGTVNTWYEKSHAGDVSSRIKGVRDVINRLGVGYYRPEAVTREHSSAQVTKEIRKGLAANWSTRWVADDIKVAVDGGVATLSGEVDSWDERSEAADIAYTTKGVWEVRNKLSVKEYDYRWDDYDYYDGPYLYPYLGW